MKSKPTRIASVARSMELLVALAEAPSDVRNPRALSAASGIGLSTTYHLLNTFEDAGLVSRDMAGNYQFGPTFAYLANQYSKNDTLPAEIVTTVRRLAKDSGESAYFSMWRQGNIEMLISELGSNPVHVAVLPGRSRGVAHARASGKVLLALSDEDTVGQMLSPPLESVTPHTITDPTELQKEFEETRRRGYAIERQEFQMGVGCISVPVHAYGRIYGAITLSVPIERLETGEEVLLNMVLQASQSIQFKTPAPTQTTHE